MCCGPVIFTLCLMVNSQIGRTLQQVGLCNLLWNKVENLWSLYFDVLAEKQQKPNSADTYRLQGTGNKRRAFILSVAEDVLGGAPPDLQSVRHAIAKTNEAAQTRNALMHGDFHISINKGVANIAVSRGTNQRKPNLLSSLELDHALSGFIRVLNGLVAEVEGLLPEGPKVPPGIEELTSVRWVQLLEQVMQTERDEPLDVPRAQTIGRETP